MRRDQIRLRLRGRGPFIIRTSDGKQFELPHPEFALIGRHNVVIESPRGLLDILDPLHIVSIRPRAGRKTPRSRS